MRQPPPPTPPNPQRDRADIKRYAGYVEEIIDQVIDVVDRTIAYSDRNGISKTQMYHGYALRKSIYAGVTEENEPYFKGDPRPATVIKNMLDECESFMSAIAKLEARLK